MVFAAALALSQFKPVDALFARAIDAHSHLSSLSAGITVSTGDPKKPYVISYRLWMNRQKDQMRASIVTQNQALRDILVKGEQMTLWDRRTNQYRTWKREPEVSARVATQTEEPTFENTVFNLFERDGIEQILVQTRDSSKSWSWMRTPNGFSLKTSSPAQLQVDIEKGTGRVTGLLVKLPASIAKTEIKYGPAPHDPDFQMTASAYQVKHLDALAIPPRYESAKAKQVAERMFKAYDRLSWLAVEISSEEGTTKILASDKKVRQVDTAADWSYDGKKVVVVDKGQKRWSADQAKPSQLVSVAAAAGTRFEPFTRMLLQGQNPLRLMLGRETTIKLVGSAEINGEQVDILEADSKIAKIGLTVRRSDGRVTSISSMTKSTNGDTLNGSLRQFRYLPKTAVTAQNAFQVSPPKGWRQLSLKELAPKAFEVGS